MQALARRLPSGFRRITTLVVVIAAFGVGACRSMAGFVRSFDMAPNGLQRQEYDLRRGLMTGSYDSVLRLVTAKKSDVRPDDRLLRAMYGGIASYYAGDYSRAASALDRASEMAEDRYTKSLRRGAASLVSSDRALAYTPPRTEWLFAHYYAMLSYARRNDAREAAVEARRLSALLERFAEDSSRVDARTFGMLHYLAGVVFEMDGDRTDADVSYRNAAAFLGTKQAALGLSADSGDVLVIVERGFVAHRVERSINVGIDTNDVTVFGNDRSGRRRGRRGHKDDRTSVWTAIKESGRSPSRPKKAPEPSGGIPHPRVRKDVPPPAPPDATVTRPGRSVGTSDPTPEVPHPEDEAATTPPDVHTPVDSTKSARRDNEAVSRALTMRIRSTIADPAICDDRDYHDGFSIGSGYFLRVAWPAYRMPESAGPLSVQVGDVLTPMSWTASLSEAVVAEYRRDLPLVLGRATVRAAVKYGATKLAEDKGGKVAGVMTDVGGALLERADTRSWHLLPNDIAVTRVRLPAGQHTISIAGNNGRLYAMDVTVRAGAISLATTRLWGAPEAYMNRRH